MTKTFKVGIVPGTIVPVTIENQEAKVSDLFCFAGLDINCNYTIRRNGVAIGLNEPVWDSPENSTFYASRMIKGN